MSIRRRHVAIKSLASTSTASETTFVTLPAAPWEDAMPRLAKEDRRVAAKSRGVAPRSARKGHKSCAVPGCDSALYWGNRNGVCRSHNHAIGFCRCPQCMEKQA